MAMTVTQAETLLQKVFRDEFGQPDLVLKPEMTAADVEGWDSHKQIELILACEDAFGVRLKPREVNALKSVGEMARHLAELAGKTGKK
jgi:acyl carrier protein